MNPVAAGAAGLVIGRERIAYAEIRRTADGWQLVASREVAIAPDLLTGPPAPDTAAVLAATLREVAGDFSRRYLPLHVGLADPLVHFAVFELEQLPVNSSRQAEFARWRVAEALHLGESVCSSQPMGADDSQQLLLAMAMEGTGQRIIASALASAGLVPWTLGACSGRLFNHYQPHLAQGAAALVVLTPDSWALWLCDNQGRPRRVRARWRRAAEREESPAADAADIERSVVAYAHSRPGRAVERLLVAATDADDAIGAALARLAPGGCEFLPLVAIASSGEGGKGLARAPLIDLAAAIATAS